MQTRDGLKHVCMYEALAQCAYVCMYAALARCVYVCMY